MMQKTLKLNRQMKTLIALALIMIALSGSLAPTLRAQSSSAPNSPNSVTRAGDDDGLRRACAEAVEELKAARKLLAAQGVQIEKQQELLELEQKISAGLKNLRNLDESEKAELRKALFAKDRQLAALESENKILKKQRFTFWKGVKIVVVAAGAGFIAGVIFSRD